MLRIYEVLDTLRSKLMVNISTSFTPSFAMSSFSYNNVSILTTNRLYIIYEYFLLYLHRLLVDKYSKRSPKNVREWSESKLHCLETSHFKVRQGKLVNQVDCRYLILYTVCSHAKAPRKNRTW